LDLEPPAALIHVRFSPDEGKIPMPSDLLRDEEAGRLDIPLDRAGLSDAEVGLYRAMSEQDGWPTTQPLTFEFSGPVRPDSLNEETFELWRWGDEPVRVEGVDVRLDPSGTQARVEAPRQGWRPGARYFAWVRGGGRGARGAAGEPVDCDAAFFYLRMSEALDDPEHEYAFPGATRSERMEAARSLEEGRQSLAPYFSFLTERDIRVEEIAALWSFTATARTELAMDRESQRMPLPIDLLLDPETGRVDIPLAEWDTELEREAKLRLRQYDGFALSAELSFELTRAVDPTTVNEGSIELYDLSGDRPVLVEASFRVLEERYVLIEPAELPLAAGSQFGVVVRDTLRDAEGGAVIPMPLGHLLVGTAPVEQAGASRVDGLERDSALRVESTRVAVAPLLEEVGREGLLTAWSFQTMTVQERLREILGTAERLGLPPEPNVMERRNAFQAFLDFPLGIGSSVFEIERVLYGTIRTADFLDPRTRGWRADGEYEELDMEFTMTIPRGVDGPIPVVIFGHAIMTERRFVLAIGDALARRGFAAISIDFPYHGERSYCFDGGPISVPDPRSGELTSFNPCPTGARCSENGRCVNGSGTDVGFRMWPVLGYPVTSGAAFLEIEDIAHTTDHFDQALVDLGGLMRSLRSGAWNERAEVELDTERVFYVGQSLGGIIGSVFSAMTPELQRVVLNVPGADMVDLFRDSTWFGPQVNAYFTRESIDPSSYTAARFFNIARWIVDRVDPQSVAHRFRESDRPVMIQMALADFIIPNTYTQTLERLSGAPRRDYVGEHAFLVIPIEPAYLRGTLEMAGFLAGDFNP